MRSQEIFTHSHLIIPHLHFLDIWPVHILGRFAFSCLLNVFLNFDVEKIIMPQRTKNFIVNLHHADINAHCPSFIA